MSFVSFYLQGISLFLLSFQTHWHKLIHNIPLIFLISGKSVQISLLSSLIFIICAFNLFSPVWLEVYNFSNLFKEPAFVLLVFPVVFPVIYLIISTLILIISSLYLRFHLLLFFSFIRLNLRS